MFTNKTNELPIVTEIVDDLMAEYNEVIIICLPNLQNYTMAEPTDPSCVRVTINDNDRKTDYTRFLWFGNLCETVHVLYYNSLDTSSRGDRVFKFHHVCGTN